MMAASSADYKDNGREEKEEEGSKPKSSRALWMLFVLIIVLFAVVVVVSCGVVGYLHMSQQIDNLQKQVNNDSEHSCAQLKEDSIQIPWQHLQQNVSMLYDHIHELYNVYTKISAIELNVSQVNANSTNLQLLNLAFALSELQHDLDSTTRNFMITKSALEVSISQLTVRANSTDIQLANLTATLGEAQNGLQQTIALLRAEAFGKVSTIESQLETYANRTDAQLRDLTSALSELRYNLTSTRQELSASKSAIDLLTIRANSTELHLRNITSTLGELHSDIDDNQHQLNRLSSMYEEHERMIHQMKGSEPYGLTHQTQLAWFCCMVFELFTIHACDIYV